MKGRVRIDRDLDQIHVDGELHGSLTAFEEFAKETHKDIVEKHTISKRLKEITENGVKVRLIADWIAIAEDIL